jgi:hypothetical protein
VITIYENGEIEGIEDANNLTSPDIFTRFVVYPIKSHKFIFQHWDAAYLSLFVYQLQPLTPELVYCAVHAVNGTDDKGNDRTVKKLEEIAEILDLKGFRIIGYTFDKDSYFNRLHSELQQHWNIETFEEATPNMISNARARHLIITDPPHILNALAIASYQVLFESAWALIKPSFASMTCETNYHSRQLFSIIHELPRCMIH